MEQQVTVMQWYVVTGTAGATVSTPEGVTLCTIPDGGQGSFFAITSTIVTSDDSVSVVKATFKYAPAKLKALGLIGGGVSALPNGYLAAEFLEMSTSKFVNIGYRYLQDETTGLQVVAEYLKKSPNVACQFTQAGGGLYTRPFIYPDLCAQYWGKQYKFAWVDGKVTSSVNFKNNKMAIHGGQAVALTNTPTADELSKTPRLVILPNFHGKCWNLKISQGTAVIADFCPAITQNGKAAFFDRVTGFEMTLDEWSVGLTLAQARKLDKLPAGGGTLKVSLPSNWQEDEGVVNALATAEAKGWVFTYQTYEAEAGAAATFALRRIWVRKQQSEHGGYVAADGSRWLVEWCAGMIGADPQEHGYEPFRSVDAAVAYWELVPYANPEDELLTEPTTNEYE